MTFWFGDHVVIVIYSRYGFCLLVFVAATAVTTLPYLAYCAIAKCYSLLRRQRKAQPAQQSSACTPSLALLYAILDPGELDRVYDRPQSELIEYQLDRIAERRQLL